MFHTLLTHIREDAAERKSGKIVEPDVKHVGMSWARTPTGREIPKKKDLPPSHIIQLANHLPITQIPDPMQGIYGLYYINLDTSVERRKYMETILSSPIFANTPIRRIRGLDGRPSAAGGGTGFDPHEYFIFRDRRTPNLRNVELATTYSHLSAIYQFVQDCEAGDAVANDPIGLILEDDISLEFVPYWKKTLAEIATDPALDPSWQILQLNYTLFDYVPVAPYDKWTEEHSMCSSAAYMIRYSGAKFLMDMLAAGPDYVSGQLIFRIPEWYNSPLQIDFFKYHMLNSYIVTPPIFTYRDNNDSTIHGEHVNYHANSKELTKKMWIGLDIQEELVALNEPN